MKLETETPNQRQPRATLATMMGKRLETVDGLTRRLSPCPFGTWRWSGVGKALLAAAVVLLAQPTTSATYHQQARRHRGRACHIATRATAAVVVAPATSVSTEQGNKKREAYAFVPSLSPAAVWSSFQRQHVGADGTRTAQQHHSSSTSSIWRAATGVVVGTAGVRPRQGVGFTTSRTGSLQPSRAERGDASENQSVEGKNATVIITAAGGRPHTDSSRAKISASNKGKQPWNKGGSHSEETRRKIAEGTRRAALKRKEATAASLVRSERGKGGGVAAGVVSFVFCCAMYTLDYRTKPPRVHLLMIPYETCDQHIHTVITSYDTCVVTCSAVDANNSQHVCLQYRATTTTVVVVVFIVRYGSTGSEDGSTALKAGLLLLVSCLYYRIALRGSKRDRFLRRPEFVFVPTYIQDTAWITILCRLLRRS